MATRLYQSGAFVLTVAGGNVVLDGFTEAGGAVLLSWGAKAVNAGYKTLASAINTGVWPQNCEILGVGYDSKVKTRGVFSAAKLKKITFPKVAPALNQAAHLELELNASINYEQGDNSTVPMNVPAQGQWLGCNYKLDLGNLPTQKVASIDGFSMSPMGVASDFLIGVSQVDAQLYRQAMQTGAMMNAAVKYFTTAMQVFFKLSFPAARIVKELPQPMVPRGQIAHAMFLISPGKPTFTFGA